MKKLVFSLITVLALTFVGCIETTEEVTLGADGSGTIYTTSDFSAALAMAKAMGGADAEKMDEVNKDTTIQLSSQIDSVQSLSAEEKNLLRDGTLRITINLKDEKGAMVYTIPFKKVSDIPAINKASAKLMAEAMKEQMGDGAAGMDQMGEMSSIEGYYDISYSKDQVKSKINKDKYANLATDSYLTQMKEASSMGIVVKSTQVYNLPRPAKKAEGKNVKLSDDKKKVTISTDINDFFEDPSVLEFEIEF